MQDHVPEMTAQFKLKPEVPQLLGHHVTCECGKVVFIPCLAAKLSRGKNLKYLLGGYVYIAFFLRLLGRLPNHNQ